MYINLSGIKRERITEMDDVFSLDHDDWMAEYEKDKASGNIIMITDSKIIKNGMKPNNDSLFDSRFNIPTDIDEKIVEYACDCGKFVGRYNEGQTCPDCKSIVSVRYSIELLRRGWIDLNEYKIIIPAMYNKIRAYIGRRKLEEILSTDNVLDHLTKPWKPDPSNPFRHIGIVEFERRYIEILEFFKHSTTKPELYKILLDRRDIAFSSKIYVMSSAHRPGFISQKSKSFNYHNINALFIKILTDLNLVKKGRRTGRKAVEIIGNIQTYLMQIHDLSIFKLRGKERLVRNNIISGRLWYSSRMVIISETETDDIDSTRMSYKGFIGMFELEIMNAMLRGYGDPSFARMTTAECRMYLTRCKYSNEIDEKIYSICYDLIHKRKDDGLYVIIDRNPSFDLGSIQMFKIADIFRDARKHVLTIPHNSLVEFNGDFDGDVLNVYSPKERCVIDAFKEGFMPSKLILDRSGGYYNSNMAPIKDEFAFIKSFCDGSFKPINPEDVKLEDLEDILSKIETPFDYRKIELEKQAAIFRKSLSDESYYNRDEVYKCDPIIIIENSGKKDEFIKLAGGYDPTGPKDVLCYDPFEVLDKEQFCQCSA